jgi:6,7-dimethyl-8-ribityllumazine synthase
MTSVTENINNLISHDESSAKYQLFNLNTSNNESIDFEIIIIHSSYNDKLNQSLLNGYLNALGTKNYQGNIAQVKIPGGAFELPLLTEKIIKKYQPQICLVIGCIVKGDTKHYDFLSATVIDAISNLSMQTKIPILNGVLTVETKQQAVDRVGAKLNKGLEYAMVTLDTLEFLKKHDSK